MNDFSDYSNIQKRAMQKCNTPSMYLICGTPGVGKSTVCNAVVERLREMYHQTSVEILNLNNIAEGISGYAGYDDGRQCKVLDEKSIKRHVKSLLLNQSNDSHKLYIMEYHDVSEWLPRKWFKKVFILTIEDIKFLSNRLKHRNYSEDKIRENIECEIFREIVDSGIKWFGKKNVIELKNENKQDLDNNVNVICKTIMET
ncbi:hypothetical protein GJ496_012038 [Pomphorhynchus laevis]|nr:hypothetical protein GJ496_012038 [Pomphorhynchus laevis]